MKNKPERDFNLIFHINKHYSELIEEFSNINSLESFMDQKHIRKSILFDLFQIGELLNHLSEDFIKEFGEKEILAIINIRNRIVHGYGEVDDDLIYKSIKNQLPDFISRVNRLGQIRYERFTDALIGKEVRLYSDKNNALYYTDAITTLFGTFQTVEFVEYNYFIDGGFFRVIDKTIRGNKTVLLIERPEDYEDLVV